MRTWARENGHKVSARGRVSAELVTAYERATA
ncbi:Lsr2 family DNA-binding protein [Nocardia aurea]